MAKYDFKGHHIPISAVVHDNMPAMLVWPAKATPVSFGWRSEVRALVVGNLFDGATPMVESKWMRNAFPNGAMVTWQGIGHW